MIGWITTATTGSRDGEAHSPAEAWRAATDAAVELAADDPSGRIDLTVGPEAATLYPATDTAGQFDPAATRKAAQRLLADVVG